MPGFRGRPLSGRANPLVFVRSTIVYPVPPVCHALWTVDNWSRVARRTVEPLVLDSIGYTWTATGERNEQGQLLYRIGAPTR
jgi:hypothetical protein